MSHGSPMKTGFQGTIGSLPLVDLLQVWSMNGFSGQVVVTSQGRTGHLYYVEGGVVHAESDELSGEEAVRRIVAWPTGAFELHPNTVTIHRTIQKTLSHLLLEAHQELDEQRRSPRGTVASAPPNAAAVAPATIAAPVTTAAPVGAGRTAVLEQIRAIRGVTQVVRFGKDGRPAGDAGPGTEALAAKGLYLFLTHAVAVGQAFGLHELTFAAVHGERESFVLAHAGGQFLCAAVAQDAPLDPIVAQIRTLLTRPRAS